MRFYSIDTTSDSYKLWVKLAGSCLRKLEKEGVSKRVISSNKHVLRQRTALDKIIHDLYEERWLEPAEKAQREGV